LTTTVFVEGGGQGKDLRTRCREGFHDFLSGLPLNGRRPKIVACGSRADAFDRFRTALGLDPRGKYMLLVDSEEVVSKKNEPWNHVRNRIGDGWERPECATDSQLHFMAVCMESWLIADGESLSGFYGQGFKNSSLPEARDIESVDKDRIMKALQSATRDTTKGEYSKGKISFAALSAIKVGVVRAKMPHCDRMATTLTA